MIQTFLDSNWPLWDFFKSIQDHPEYFDNEYYALMWFMTLCVVGLLVFITYCVVDEVMERRDNRTATEQIITGAIIDKRYKGQETHSGTGTAIMPNTSGGLGVGFVSTSSTSPEEFLFFVRSGEVKKVSVSMEQFYAYNVGDKVRLAEKIGGRSKQVLDIKLIA